jgi:DNA invertase Pin-like site-specific DNA recombinase
MIDRKWNLATLKEDPEALHRATKVLHEIEKLPERTMPYEEARAYLFGATTVGYRRVSRLVQDAYGGEAQSFDIEIACQKFKMLAPARMYEDWVTASGKVTRGQFEELLRDATAGKFQVLVVGRVDRFTRHVAMGALQMNELLAAGVVVYFAREDIAAGVDEGWPERVENEFAKARTALVVIRENAKYTSRARRLKGEYIGTVAYGWRKVSRKLLEPVPDEAEIVKRIFRDVRAEELKIGAIADALNRDGFRTRRGNLFSKSFVYKVIKNPVHIGTWRQNVNPKRGGYLEIPHMHEGVVSKSDWMQAQRILCARGRARRPVEVGTDYVFRGLLRCAEIDPGTGKVCSTRFIGAASKQGEKRFVSYTHAVGVGCCAASATTTWGVSEFTVLRQVSPLFRSADLPAEAVEVVVRYMREVDEGARPDRAKLVAGYTEDLDRLDLAFREGAYGRNPHVAVATWKTEKARIQRLLSELPPEPEFPSAQELGTLLSLRETWAEASATDRNRLLRSCLAAIYVARDGGADTTLEGKARIRGRQRVVQFEPLPEHALLMAYMFSEHKELLGPQKQLLLRISGVDQFNSWLSAIRRRRQSAAEAA